MTITKLRWRIWGLFSRLPGICPANAHSLVIDGYHRSPAIDRICRQDLAGNGGSCWCGKIRQRAAASPEGSQS